MTDRDRYLTAQKAMQVGVGTDLSHGAANLAPKQLRVGLNTAHADHAALVSLLIKLGVFSEDDYVKALADAMEGEVTAYEERLGVKLA